MGRAAMNFTTKYWTVADQNNNLLPLNLEILLNRALWLGIGLAILAFCYFRFSFSFFASEGKVNRKTVRRQDQQRFGYHPLYYCRSQTQLTPVYQSLNQYWTPA